MKYILKRKLFLCISAAVIIFFEIFVFNFASFHLFFGDYETRDLKADYTNSETVNGKENIVFEFVDVGIPVGTISVNADFDSPFLRYKIVWTDETCADYSYRNNIFSGEIINGDKRSSVIPCHFSGNVSKLKITLYPEENADVIYSDTPVTVNETVPFHFSFTRTIILFVAVNLTCLLMSEHARCSIDSCRQKTAGVTAVITGVALIFAFTLSLSASGGFSDFTSTTGNQMTKELVDAFIGGSAKLDSKVPEWILELDNPYDWSQHGSGGYWWDHVLYEGSLYSYYGIAPVVLLFVPYTLLTGYYFPSVWAVFIFGAGGLVFLSAVYHGLCKRFFKDIPIGMYACGLLMLYSVCGIWYCFPIPNFYEIAQSSGFFFVTLGAYFLISSDIMDGDPSLWRISASAAAFSLGVLCRPTLAVWCVAAVLFMIFGFVRCVRNKCSKGFKIKYIITAALPFVLIGGAQMFYNYIRFDSPFDFGIQYSLTINDFTAAQYHTRLAAIGFYNFLAAPPSFSTSFPFVHSSYSTLDVNGFYFTANRNAVGIFFRAFPMFCVFMAPKVIKMIKNKKDRIWYSILWASVTLVIPFIIIFSIWESGYGVRYSVDFYWQMLLGALIIMFMLYRGKNTCEGQSSIYLFTAISAVCSVIVCFALVFSYIYPSEISVAFHPALEKFARLFEFWKW